jgi:hypothetical protein
MLALIAVAAAVSTPVAIEFEAAVGIARPYEDGFKDFSYDLAPIFNLRAGVDFVDHVGLSLSFVSANGPQGSGNPFPFQPAFAAWAAFVNLRLHSSGDLQLFVEGGVGPGHLIRLQENNLIDSQDHPPFSGTAALAWRVATGVRGRIFESLWLGADLSLTSWNGVVRPFTTRAGPAASDLSAYSLAAMLSLTFRSPL